MDRLLRDAHALAREWWDPSVRLLTGPRRGIDGGQGPDAFLPATVWWAHGLLRRAGAGDRELAEVALRGVLDREPDSTRSWLAVGAGLALVLRDHELPSVLATDARAVVVSALRAHANDDVDLTATTVAVHRAWLELEVGRWLADEELLAVGARRAQALAADAGVRGHVAEHVGPTSTGMTLLGLSLWAERPPVADLAPLGRALRDEVWHDLLAVWHPGLRTLVPPFTRAHAMDLRAHVGATGLWLAWLVDGVAPVPPLHEPPLHDAHVLPLVFLIDALAGASPDVRDLAPLVRAQPARQGAWYDRVGERVWTGWTGGDLAVGAEWSPVDRGGASEAVTAAAVWRGHTGHNAWLRLHQTAGAVEARVEHADGVVRLVHGTAAAPVELWVGGPGAWRASADALTDGVRTWQLEGVAAVTPVGNDAPHVASAWAIASTGDGIVLSTAAPD